MFKIDRAYSPYLEEIDFKCPLTTIKGIETVSFQHWITNSRHLQYSVCDFVDILADTSRSLCKRTDFCFFKTHFLTDRLLISYVI